MDFATIHSINMISRGVFPSTSDDSPLKPGTPQTIYQPHAKSYPVFHIQLRAAPKRLEVKPLALLASGFQEVLLLDAAGGPRRSRFRRSELGKKVVGAVLPASYRFYVLFYTYIYIYIIIYIYAHPPPQGLPFHFKMYKTLLFLKTGGVSIYTQEVCCCCIFVCG